MKYIYPFTWFSGLLCCVASCEPTPIPPPPSSHVYDYYVSVEDTNPMVGAVAQLVVQTGGYTRVKRSEVAPPSAHLFAYSSFHWIAQPAKGNRPDSSWVPRDTVSLPLTRPQLDTIYHLTRQVFQLAAYPPSRNNTEPPPPPSAHDLDNFLAVTFRYNNYSGPSFYCEGYEERNAASYTLRGYLKALQARALKKRP
ncbi:hypothetical protein HBN54_002505 [Hymenobacter sp. 1B]|uniref:DUF4136 domain-containing protein n=1 Tax=Hymenobacter artigasi TaxID=2719616 RepID=A0ABX1HLP2_9BACT|nr:hypothetical protein [Hymenobacter artigasi]